MLGAAAAENTLKGDVNRDGVVNIIDAGIVQQYLADYTDVKERFESGEYDLEAAKVTGSSVSVYIKAIIPEKMKVKLVIVDVCEEHQQAQDINYFYSEDHISRWNYAPEESGRAIISSFE